MFIDFKERGREKERERGTSMWEKNVNQLPLKPPWTGTEPTIFDVWDDAPMNEPPKQGKDVIILHLDYFYWNKLYQLCYQTYNDSIGIKLQRNNLLKIISK